MPDLATFFDGAKNFFAVIGAIAAIATIWKFVHDIREKRAKQARELPGVKAVVNRSPSIDGWRSVNLHITPPKESAGPFDFRGSGWRIYSATLKSPRDADLAFAREGDHSLYGPIFALSDRVMSGRMEAHLQPFAMEFFMRFPETPTADQGRRARFRVTIGRKAPHRECITLDARTEVPDDAERKRLPAPTS